MTTSSRHPSFRGAAVAVLTCLLLTACTSWPASAEEADRIAELLCLQPGGRVADVGAGDGEWTEELARQVGETGHVYATEVEEDLVKKIRKRAARAGLDNVTAILGDQDDTGLPAGCCDAVLLRLVYHHFTDPSKMRASLKRALRPGGIVAVIDLDPQKHWRKLPGVPDRGGHGIPMEDLIAEMTADGFSVVSRYDEWGEEEDDYCVVFRR